MNPIRFFLLAAAYTFAAAGAFAKAPPKKAPKESPDDAPAPKPDVDAAAFVKAVRHGHAREATTQLIAVLRRECAEGILVWSFFAVACSTADDEQLAELRELLIKDPPDDLDFPMCYAAYTAARFRRYAQQLHDTHAKITLPEPHDPVPEAVAANPELKRAWIAYHRASDAFVNLPLTEPAPATEDQPPRLHAALRQSLAKPEVSAIHRLPAALKAEGPDAQEDPEFNEGSMKQGLLLALLDAHRPAEALGAALHQWHISDWRIGVRDFPGLPEIASYHESVAQFLAAAGLDWEDVYVGALLPAGRGNEVPPPIELSLHDSREILAARGSQRGVQLALAAIRTANLEPHQGLTFLFHLLELRYDEDHEALPPLPRKEKLTKDTRRALIETFGWYLSPERPFEELEETLGHLPRPILAELRPALEKLLRHPSYVVSQRARGVMESAHLSLKGLPLTPPPPPLHIRVLAGDQPVAKTTFTYDFGGLTTFEVTTDAEGWVKVPIADKLHPEQIDSVHLRSIAKTPVKDDHWPGPWLDLTVNVKGEIDRPHTATVATTSLDIALDPQSAVPTTTPAQLALIHAPSAEDLWLEHEPDLTLPFTGTITLDHVPPGPCCIAVSAPGAATYYSKTIDIGKNGATRVVRLERGHEVRLAVTVPKAHDSGHGFHLQFRQNDKPFKAPATTDGKGWTSFPVGKFEAYLEWVEYDGPKPGQKLIRDSSTVPANGLDTDVTGEGTWTHDFEITADSPAMIDLGTFPLMTEEKEDEAKEEK